MIQRYELGNCHYYSVGIKDYCIKYVVVYKHLQQLF
jgi:hypothetical protein